MRRLLLRRAPIRRALLRWALLIGVALQPALAGCDGGDGVEGTGPVRTGSGFEGPVEKHVLDIASALRDDRSGDPREDNAWVDRVRATLARMDQAPPELGRALLAYLETQAGLEEDQRARLLEAGVRALAPHAPDEVAGLLALRVERYGHPMMERNQACLMLGRYCPVQAVTVLRPLLSPETRGVTLPDTEFILRGYIDAAEGAGEDPMPVLVNVATDPRNETYPRTLALRGLAGNRHPSALAAMESVMVESTGDAHVRRAAVQAYTKTVSEAQAIARIEEVLLREADFNMQRFLQDTIAKLRGER